MENDEEHGDAQQQIGSMGCSAQQVNCIPVGNVVSGDGRDAAGSRVPDPRSS